MQHFATQGPGHCLQSLGIWGPAQRRPTHPDQKIFPHKKKRHLLKGPEIGDQVWVHILVSGLCPPGAGPCKQHSTIFWGAQPPTVAPVQNDSVGKHARACVGVHPHTQPCPHPVQLGALWNAVREWVHVLGMSRQCNRRQRQHHFVLDTSLLRSRTLVCLGVSYRTKDGSEPAPAGRRDATAGPTAES